MADSTMHGSAWFNNLPGIRGASSYNYNFFILVVLMNGCDVQTTKYELPMFFVTVKTNQIKCELATFL